MGRVVQAKGVFVLLRVLSRLPDVTLDIVGDGPDRRAVEQSIKEMGLEERVVCHGWVSDEDTLRGLYTRNDVAIVPSIWPEPFAIVGLEAGMCRRPSVAFDVGGISDWLQHGRTGYLVEEGNSEELERTLNRILSDRKKLQEMGEAAAEYVGATFSVETHMEQLQKIFDALVSDETRWLVAEKRHDDGSIAGFCRSSYTQRKTMLLGDTAYSWRKASMGSRRAAWRAGK